MEASWISILQALKYHLLYRLTFHTHFQFHLTQQFLLFIFFSRFMLTIYTHFVRIAHVSRECNQFINGRVQNHWASWISLEPNKIGYGSFQDFGLRIFCIYIFYWCYSFVGLVWSRTRHQFIFIQRMCEAGSSLLIYEPVDLWQSISPHECL